MAQVKPARNDQVLLGVIFVIAREEDDVPAHARAVRALMHEGRGVTQRSEGKEEKEEA